MATYVVSDIHGHFKTFERLLEDVSPGAEDQVWVLGDMIDRGPDPVSVMRACRDLPGAHVLMGNHEDLMRDFLLNGEEDQTAAVNWAINGGGTTMEGLDKLPHDEELDLLEWALELPTAGHVRVGARPFLLVHAGLRPLDLTAGTDWDDAALEGLLERQSIEDVLWIREEFWGAPTGLLDARGEGPIVVAGHTPVPYVEPIADAFDRPARNEEGLCQMMRVGASEATGGVADRWAIDCGAAGGAGWGRILMLRLDDEREFYATVEEGE
ncbi:MAG: metallophosphoesterase family protein [Atopobiaceae bacterium]|nr:metallophosphoesterase family protein [Atopobiaceae bacterium]